VFLVDLFFLVGPNKQYIPQLIKARKVAKSGCGSMGMRVGHALSRYKNIEDYKKNLKSIENNLFFVLPEFF